jgi:pilus assembly protein CpaB
MKPKTMILMGVAIACGLGASYMTSRLLAERGEGPPPEVPKVVVLVAKKNLDMGLMIKSPNDLFIEKQFAKGDEPKNAVVDYGMLKSRYLKRSLRGGDHVTPDDLADSIGGINWQLPEGHRAIGIRVSTEGIAGGWASLPGSRVDIISTVRRGNDDDSFSQVLLEDVLVLAADGANTRNEQNTAMPASVLTLALNADDALKVTLASQMGPLHLMLRKQGDKAKSETERVTISQVIRNSGGRQNDATEKDNWEQSPSGDPVNPKLDIPAIKAEEQSKDVTKVEPLVKTHVMTFIEGETQRKVVYRLGDNDEVLSSDLPETPRPTPAAQPTPPAVQPPAPPAPAQPVTPPAPKGKNGQGDRNGKT